MNIITIQDDAKTNIQFVDEGDQIWNTTIVPFQIQHK
jgi:hypothetical protein